MSNRICIACEAENPADYAFCFHCNHLAPSSDDVPTVRNVTAAASKTKKKASKKAAKRKS
jgi:hypothetical protein